MTYSWDAIRALSAAARAGSLTRAAAELGVSVATLGRRIDGLEGATGLSLLERRPDGVRASADGERLLAGLAPSLDGLSELPRIVRDLQGPEKTRAVRISSTEPILTDILAPALRKLRDLDPSLTLELETSNAVSQLNRGEADMAIRMVRPTEATLIARGLNEIGLGLYAHPDDLGGATELSPDLPLFWYDPAFGAIAENVYLDRQGWANPVPVRAGSVRTLLRAVQAGGGAAPLPHFLARPAGLIALRVPTLPSRRPWLVFHRDKRTDPAHRTIRRWVVDSFAERLGD